MNCTRTCVVLTSELGVWRGSVREQLVDSAAVFGDVYLFGRAWSTAVVTHLVTVWPLPHLVKVSCDHLPSTPGRQSAELVCSYTQTTVGLALQIPVGLLQNYHKIEIRNMVEEIVQWVIWGCPRSYSLGGVWERQLKHIPSTNHLQCKP